MDYKCGVCGEVVKDDLRVFMNHTEDHIVEIIKQAHPEWVEENGMCHKCLDYYKLQMKGR